MAVAKAIPAGLARLGFWRALWRMVRDPRASRFDKSLLVAAVVYDLSPLDLIPGDLLTGIGLVDDIAVTGLVLLFLRWKMSRQ
jgi:uncharacterized membrane protein YkvA (DUF1232 family)